MQRRVAVAALALALASSASVTPALASGATELVLTGSASAYVDVTFPKSLRVDEMQSRATTHGRYGGFIMYRIGERLTVGPASNIAGSLHSPQLASAEPGGPAVPFGFRDVLAPGRYRVILLADGPTTVRVPVTGLARTLRLSPRRRVRSGIDIQDRSAVTDVAANAVNGITEPVTVGSHTWVVSDLETYYDSVPNAWAEHLQACVVTKGTFDCPTAVGPGVGESIEYGTAIDIVWHVPPGTLKPGSYVAMQKRLGASTPAARITGVAFWFDVA